MIDLDVAQLKGERPGEALASGRGHGLTSYGENKLPVCFSEQWQTGDRVLSAIPDDHGAGGRRQRV